MRERWKRRGEAEAYELKGKGVGEKRKEIYRGTLDLLRTHPLDGLSKREEQSASLPSKRRRLCTHLTPLPSMEVGVYGAV
jgi:hypothetical protein